MIIQRNITMYANKSPREFDLTKQDQKNINEERLLVIEERVSYLTDLIEHALKFEYLTATR